MVIPAFQSEKTIAGAISSLLSQDFDSWEALVVDDGSTDRTRDIVREFQESDPRISYFYQPVNRGPGPPSNYGIDRAEGEFVLFLHSDDELVGGSLSSLDSEIGESAPDVILFGIEEVRRGRRRVLHDESFVSDHRLRGRLTVVEETPELLMWPPAAWTRSYRRVFLVQNDFRFPEGTYEDIPWTMVTTLVAKSILVAETIVYRYITRQTGSSITTSQSIKSLDRVMQLRRAREQSLGLTPSDSIVPFVSALAAVHLTWAVGASYRTVPENLQDEFFSQCATELSNWPIAGAVDPQIKSEPLMKTSERVALTRALHTGQIEKWLTAHARIARARRWRKRLTPSRYWRFRRG